MNTDKPDDGGMAFADEVAEELAKLLQAQPLPDGWEITADPGNHLVVARGRTPAGTHVEIVAYCPKSLPSPLGAVRIEREFSGESVSDARALVLAVPTISAELREECRALGWGWFDMDGNCEIHIPNVLDIRSGSQGG